jgi:glutaminyl-tRNA synthetase
MGVLEPIKVIITNYPDNEIEYLDAKNNPEDESAGKRKLAFSKEIFIDKNDFMEDPPKKFFRLSPGKEVRLKFAYYIVCENVIKNDSGEITEIHCSYDPNTKGGMSEDGRKVRGTLHWVSAQEFIEAEVRLYDRLFMSDNPENNGDFIDDLNPESLSVVKKAKLETSLSTASTETIYQFERTGYFIIDSKDSSFDNLIFNRAVSLRDSWARLNR